MAAPVYRTRFFRLAAFLLLSVILHAIIVDTSNRGLDLAACSCTLTDYRLLMAFGLMLKQ